MIDLERRTLLTGTAGLAATAVLARPNIARAADKKTLTIWWSQGFYPAEDAALRTLVADWEKKNDIKVNLSLVTGGPLHQKVVSAMTTGQVPDLVHSVVDSWATVPQAAWNDQLVDVSDVVETQEKEYSKTALHAAHYYNNVTKKHSYYGVPIKVSTLNIPMWKTLIEKAGYQMSDIPKTWDEFFAFFEPVQDKLRKKGMRHVHGLGFNVSSTGEDPNDLFNQCLIAYGGGGIVTPDGKAHLDDPKVQKAMVDSLNMLAIPYRNGYVPKGAINWGDGDNNNAFHSKGVVMTPNDTISISSAVMDNKQWYYHDIVTHPMPLDNSGKPVDAMLAVPLGFIMKGAKNIDGAKSFLRDLIQPKNLDNYLKQTRARYLPPMPSIVQNDPYWTDKKDQHRDVAVKQGVLGPTTVWPTVNNPGYAQVNSEYIWTIAVTDVIHGMKAEDAAAKAFKRAAGIFAKYQTA